MFAIITTILAIAIITTILVIWLVLSIRIVGPAEMAVKVIFGKPVKVYDSGWVFDLRLPLGRIFKCFLQRYPKKMYNFDYKARETITIAGMYPPDNGVQYGALKVKVDAVAYLNFPREIVDEFDVEKDVSGKVTKKTHPLIKILRAGVPTEDEKLKDWTEEAVIGALRLSFGQMTWRQAVEDMKTINKKVNQVFLDADGALIKAGFREPGIKLVVAEIHLPKSVEDALTLPEKARLEADAAQKKAETQAIDRMGTILHTVAISRGVGLKDIQEEVKKDPKLQRELLRYIKTLHAQLEKAEKGAFFEFNAPGKSGLDKSILNSIALLTFVLSGKMPMGGGKGKEEKPEKEEETEEKRKPRPFSELSEETRQQTIEIEKKKKGE